MAFQFVVSFYSDPIFYTLEYDKLTGEFNLITTGSEESGNEPSPTLPPDAGFSAGDEIGSFCVGTTEHKIIAKNSLPYAQAVIVEDSVACGYVPPPPPPDEPGDTYGLVYRGTFSNTEEGFLQDETDVVEAVTVFICDGRSIGSGIETEYIEFECSGEPLNASVEDNDESIYTPVRASKWVFQFNSTNEINAQTFVHGEDDRWKVIIVIKGQIVFQGFVLPDDVSENFDITPNVVTLTCVDALGLIREVPFTLVDGTTPKFTEAKKGYYKLIEWLAGALLTTGLKMDIVIADNLMEEHYPGVCAWDVVYKHYKTYEGDQIGDMVNAREVIENLLRDHGFLKQHNNRWWVRNIDEIENRTTSYFVFNYLGEFQEHVTGADLRRYIAQNKGYDIIEHVNEASTQHYRRPFGSVKSTFNYVLPKEIVDNQDFSRGQWLSPVVVPNKTVDSGLDTKTYNGVAYAVEDWTPYQGLFPSLTPSSGTAQIWRYFYEDIEVERYLRLEIDNSLNQWIRSNPIPVGFKDRFSFSIDARVDNAKIVVLGPQILKLFIILEGDNGITYYLDSLEAEREEAKRVVLGPSGAAVMPWKPYTADADAMEYELNAIDDTDSGFSLTIEVEEKYTALPTSGNLYIVLPFLDDYVEYENLQFTYTPYINGGYAPHKGQHNKVGTIPGYKAIRDEETFWGDSPKRLFKNALHILNEDGKYVLAGKWYNGAVFPGGLPSFEYLHTRGRTQIFSIWNQHNREFHILDATLQGLLTTTEVTATGLPDCVHEWVHQYDTPHTNNRRWLLLHYDMDFWTCEWTGYFVEVFNTTVTKDYDSTYEFKYLRS